MKLFLQIHDFSEDGRPQAYFSEPYLSNCHYGVLNGRDYAILRRAGLKARGLHIIPNMVNPVGGILPQTNIADFVLYPIRAIRRKNIGEAILLSLFLRRGQQLIITLPPNSPADMLSYSGWKSFVTKHDLAIEFEAGLKQVYRELVAAADFLITTSITEDLDFPFSSRGCTTNCSGVESSTISAGILKKTESGSIIFIASCWFLWIGSARPNFLSTGSPVFKEPVRCSIFPFKKPL